MTGSGKTGLWGSGSSRRRRSTAIPVIIDRPQGRHRRTSLLSFPELAWRRLRALGRPEGEAVRSWHRPSSRATRKQMADLWTQGPGGCGGRTGRGSKRFRDACDLVRVYTPGSTCRTLPLTDAASSFSAPPPSGCHRRCRGARPNGCTSATVRPARASLGHRRRPGAAAATHILVCRTSCSDGVARVGVHSVASAT